MAGSRSWLYFGLLASLLWGSYYAVAEEVLHRVTPTTHIALSVLGSAIVTVAVGLRRQLVPDLKKIAADKALIGWSIVSILCFAFGIVTIALAIKTSNATLAGLIELTYPLFTVAFQWLFFRKHHLTRGIVFGGTLVIAGVALMVVWR